MHELSRGSAPGRLLVAAALVVSACSSSTPPPEAPAPASERTAPEPAETAEPEAPPTAASEAKKPDDTIPDDYELTNGDCAALGKQYGAVAKADQMAALSPKLKPAQRDQAEANIDKVVTQLADRWIQGCQSSLVGKVADRKNLKCALGSKTVKEFDTCLNGPPPETTTAKP